jgi:pyruvate dehydrogenase E2 component (dihydrolipoamide acetyltransferase)
MSNEVKVPRLGQGMESATIVKWLKEEGDAVEQGEPLYELDTDKVTQEIESDFAGTLLKIAVREGEAEVGSTIAVIGDRSESAALEAPSRPEPPAETTPAASVETDAPLREPASAGAATNGDAVRTERRIKASPLARRIARERSVDLTGLRGTGPDGRIVAEDVERASAAPVPAAPVAAPAPPPADVERVPLTSIRSTIARRLTEAWQAPVFQISMSADMTAASQLRRLLADRTVDGPRPTVTDILTKACAVALLRHREMNARYAGDAIELYPTANVGLAVAIPQGLIVPVIRSAERKTIAELARERAELVERARSGRLQPADLADGTFTISNLGMYGVEQFTAVLNPPQAAIVAVGAAQEKPVVRDGTVVVLPLMSMTLTCDHRAVDGAVAAAFLGSVKAFLEEPALML